MNNRIGPEIHISTENPREAALFYINFLGFEVTELTPARISLNGRGLNLVIEAGPPSQPTLLFPDPNPNGVTETLLSNGCRPVDQTPGTTRPALEDPFGLTYRVVSDRS